MRIILFTGKGGVGKSTTACATATMLAADGRRTLLVSSDLAHNLSDIFGIDGGGVTSAVTDNLTILEVDILEEIRDNWESIQRYLADFLAYLDMDGVVAEEIALIPGMDALFLLTRILREIESGAWDAIIVDCAPTAGTLRLLTLTDTSSQKMNKIIQIERHILKLIRPFGKRIGGLKELLPEDDLYETFGTIIKEVGRLGEILRDPAVASVRLVLNPNKIAIAESKRAYTYFSLFGFPVDGIFVNKVYPPELESGYMKNWCRLQHDQMAAVDQSFLDTRIFSIRHYGDEPIGIGHLTQVGRDIYGAADPAAILSRVNTVAFKKEAKQVVMSIILPNLDRSLLDIGRRDNDLLINAGGYVRVFRLPDTLANTDIDTAEFNKGQLMVRFTAR